MAGRRQWSCPACTFENPPGQLQCGMCGTPNVAAIPDAVPARAARAAPARPGVARAAPVGRPPARAAARAAPVGRPPAMAAAAHGAPGVFPHFPDHFGGAGGARGRPGQVWDDHKYADRAHPPGPQPESFKPIRLYVAPESQFSFSDGQAGESACPFGVLALGSAILCKNLRLFEDDEDLFYIPDRQIEVYPTSSNVAPVVQQALDRAVWSFNKFFEDKPRQHSNPIEILSQMPQLFPDMDLQKGQAELSVYLRELQSSVVHPELFLEMGEVQLQNMTDDRFHALLRGFQGSGLVLSIVTIGYAFGVYCHVKGNFTVFDTHSKAFREFPEAQTLSGAYVAQFDDDVKRTATFITEFVLDSRKQILLNVVGQDLQQTSSANNVDLAVFSFNKSGLQEAREMMARDRNQAGPGRRRKRPGTATKRPGHVKKSSVSDTPEEKKPFPSFAKTFRSFLEPALPRTQGRDDSDDENF